MKPRTVSNANLWLLAGLLLMLGLASLACNLPYLADQGAQIEAEIAAELAETVERPVKDVRLEADMLVLTYEIPWIQAPETTLVDVALLLQTGAVQASRVSQVRVEVENQGAPYLAVTAQAKDARLLANGKLTIEAFLASLEVDDRRPVEQAVWQELERMGYTVRTVSYQENTLELAFWQPEIDSLQAMLQSWLPVWQVAVWKAPQAEQVVLRTRLFGQPDLRVSASMQHLQAYFASALTPAQFLLGLDVQDEP